MALIQSPFASLPAYRPIAYQASALGLDSPLTRVENAVVEIFQNYVTIGNYIRFKVARTAAGPPGYTNYIFDIDIQKYCQDLLGPTEALPSSFFKDVYDAVVNTEFFSIFTLIVTYEQINPTTGLLEASAHPPEASTDIAVFSISKYHTEPMDLESYIGIFPRIPDTLFLTRSARELQVCQEDNVFVSYINPLSMNMNGLFVNLFDSTGFPLTSGLTLISTLGPLTMATINAGFDQLAAMTYVLGSPNFADPNVAYYSVNVGRVIISSGPTYSYTQQSELMMYELVGKCCSKRDLRLHWMNGLAGTDSYTFNSEKELNIKTTSQRGEKALNWEIGSSTPHSVNDIGKMKLKSEAVESYRVKSRFLTNDQALWLSELLTSPKVYAEIDGEFIPVIVEDTEQTIYSQDGKIQYEIQVTLANDRIIQRL